MTNLSDRLAMVMTNRCPDCKHPIKLHASYGCCLPGCNCPTTPEDFDVHPLTEDEL